MDLWQELAATISSVTASSFSIKRRDGLLGGCINNAYRIGDSEQDYFLKLNGAEYGPMFEAEYIALEELASVAAVRVPTPIATGVVAGKAFLVTEFIVMGGDGDSAQFGRQLAQQHRHHTQYFGWERDNLIGATPQINRQESDWVTFMREHRLGYQLRLARDRRGGALIYDLGMRFCERLPRFFDSYRPQPSLLHGDLWGGNYAYSDSGEAVIFDPAIYYGDREADIAMTELFGGFSPQFYSGYEAVWPLDSGYSARKKLYNLYHIINHFNLFGGGYGAQAEGMMQHLMNQSG